jgi:hypothetical protein
LVGVVVVVKLAQCVKSTSAMQALAAFIDTNRLKPRGDKWIAELCLVVVEVVVQRGQCAVRVQSKH